jgi:Leucine-rich repeat (LRR) protein
MKSAKPSPKASPKAPKKSARSAVKQQVVEEVQPPVVTEEIALVEDEIDVPSCIVTFDEASIRDDNSVTDRNNNNNTKDVKNRSLTHAAPLKTTTTTLVDRKDKLQAHLHSKSTELYLGKKELKQIPEDLFHYKELRILWMNDNKLEQITQLVTEYVPVADTLIQSNTMAYEHSLTPQEFVKALQRNKFSGLVYLTELYLHKNKLKSIDDSGVKYLKHLKVLSLHSNLLRDLNRVLDNMRNIHLQRLDLFNNPCSHEENYKDRVLDVLGSTLTILDRHVLDESDKTTKTIPQVGEKSVVFGKNFVPKAVPEKVGLISTSVKELEQRAKVVREQKTSASIAKSNKKQIKRETEFQKTFMEGIPKSDHRHPNEEENIYSTIHERHQKQSTVKSEPKRRDFVKTYWSSSDNNKKTTSDRFHL